MTISITTLGIADYARIARRRISFILVPFFTIGFIAVSVALLAPAIYRSTGKIAVESQQIPADLVRSTVPGSAEEGIGYIQQLIMTDLNLQHLLSKFKPYETRKNLPTELLVHKLRENITIEAFHDPFSFSQSTIAFTVSFDHANPLTAQNVAAELVELFLNENIRTRTARASDTADFLAEEAESLRRLTGDLNSRVAEFKREHSNSLPEHLDLRVRMVQQAEFDLRAVQREISAAEQEMRFLEIQRSSVSAPMLSPQGSPAIEMTPAQQLQRFRADLAKSTAIYTNAHPDVVRLRRLIANLESQLREQSTGEEHLITESARNPGGAEIESRISTLQTKLSSLRTQESDLRAKLVTLRAEIMKTPETESGLNALTFEYDAALKEFENIRSRLQEAELAEALESRKMAEKFVLLEAPTVPVKPERPNRIKLMLVGLILALGAGGGVAFAAESLDNKIRDPKALISLLAARPFAVFPYIEHPEEARRRVFLTWIAWLAFLSLLGALALLVRHYDEPMQRILAQALDRF